MSRGIRCAAGLARDRRRRTVGDALLHPSVGLAVSVSIRLCASCARLQEVPTSPCNGVHPGCGLGCVCKAGGPARHGALGPPCAHSAMGHAAMQGRPWRIAAACLGVAVQAFGSRNKRKAPAFQRCRVQPAAPPISESTSHANPSLCTYACFRWPFGTRSAADPRKLNHLPSKPYLVSSRCSEDKTTCVKTWCCAVTLCASSGAGLQRRYDSET